MFKDRNTPRRDFIAGSSAAGSGMTDPTSDPYLVQVGRRAMACQFQVYFNAGQYHDAAEIAIGALDRVEHLESILTIYRDESEVSRINREAFHAPVPVGRHVMALSVMGERLYEATDGAFDLTAGPLSEVWGFARRAGSVPSEPDLQAALAQVGSEHVVIDQQQSTIRFRRAGMQLNFGGIGKGYALDQCSAILQEAGIGDFLFHGGRSSVMARGDRVGSNGGWKVGLIHPQRPQTRLAEIRLTNRALSTSGSQMQSFQHEGRRFGHILDPRTGRPSEGVFSATVLADTAAQADALSTAFYVMGPAKVQQFCEQHRDVSAILVTPREGKGQTDIMALNLSDEDFQVVQ
jgi:thiamine biosynthesis lipoprotein